VTRDNFRLEYNGDAVIQSPAESLRDAWANSLERILVAR